MRSEIFEKSDELRRQVKVPAFGPDKHTVGGQSLYCRFADIEHRRKVRGRNAMRGLFESRLGMPSCLQSKRPAACEKASNVAPTSPDD